MYRLIYSDPDPSGHAHTNNYNYERAKAVFANVDWSSALCATSSYLALTDPNGWHVYTCSTFGQAVPATINVWAIFANVAE